ncbi:prolipoprotein diacylglyceryl transferase [Alkaliflexus imshenetskii]|uniref:prolipoprotein diacylglyceryl transferase n=1 Tax=Alkaliflexus imshenetskii TaxID=286730 RepID=UPI00047C5CD7|nr:prolipoprotein diacylglyceryl transferase [Alkaliflexus imshenetskii]
MLIFNYITWAPDPEIFSLGPLSVRYYGLFFALAFLLGYYIVDRMFKRENAPEEWLERLFIYVMVATVIGARLGHVFFYGWDYYSQHPEDILKVWQGGLASHGGAIGILIAIWLYSKLITKLPMVWTLDRLVISVALAAVFIRMGNLMNSEIVGSPTTMPWGFIFLKAHGLENPELPRHPSQIYEALCYLVTFVVLMYMYWRTNAAKRPGLIFGIFLVGIFATRFFVEFLKEDQEAFEATMTLNMGQILSIPFMILAGYLIYNALTKPEVETKIPVAKRKK